MPEIINTNFVDHITIAVKDIRQAEEDYVNTFGWSVEYRYEDIPEKIRVVGFMVGQTAIELTEDIDGTGEVAKFIERSGEGVMLISYNVDDCSDVMQKLNLNGAQLIDSKPRYLAGQNRNFAFVHPRSTHGVLTEIIDGVTKV
jgi:methylmalonyl-CoA/ethylmalonyl-CoA epimerase